MSDTSKKCKLDSSFPIRLRAARLKAGLSLEDLAQNLGGIVTRQAIAKYEKGLISPSPEVLKKLSQVLEIPPPPDIPEEIPERSVFKVSKLRNNFLLQIHHGLPEDTSFILDKAPPTGFSYEEEFPACSRRASYLRETWPELTQEGELELRPEPQLPRKKQVALRIILSEKMKNYLWLEKLLRQEKAYEPPFSLSIQNVEDAELAAEKLRQCWDLGTGAVTNLMTFLEEKGIKSFILQGLEKIESLCGFYHQQPFIAVENNLPVDRLRFRAAAEIGQILFGLSNETKVIKLYNRFAAAFLLPAKIMEEYFLPVGRKIAFSELAEIKLRYGVSLQAIMRRALDLKLVTERRFRSFREMMTERGWLWREPVDYPGEEKPSRFRRLIYYAVSSEILDTARAAALAEITPEELKKEIGDIF